MLSGQVNEILEKDNSQDDLERQNAVNSTPVHLPTASAWLVTIDERRTIHLHNQRDRAVPSDPVNSTELFTTQSLSTSHWASEGQASYSVQSPVGGSYWQV